MPSRAAGSVCRIEQVDAHDLGLREALGQAPRIPAGQPDAHDPRASSRAARRPPT